MAANITITADTSAAQREIGRLTDRLEGVQGAAHKADSGLGALSGTARLAVGAFAALTASLGVKEIIDITGRFTDLNSRLINATGSQQAASKAFDAITKSANATFSSVEQTSKVFLQNSLTMNELGFTTNEQIRLSTALNNAMAVSGARGEQAASALDAFGKAMARGKFEGQDLNRILENADQLALAMADGLGVTTTELRRMVSDGVLTADKAIQALGNQFEVLEKKAADMPATISDAFVILQNNIFVTIGQLDSALGASAALASGLVFLANNMEMLVGAVGALALASTALLIPLLPAVAAMTVLAGKVLAILALGAAVGFVAKEMGVFNDKTKDTADPLEELKTKMDDAAAAAQRQVDAAIKLNTEQTRSLNNLFNKIALEKQSIGLGQLETQIKKNTADAARILKVEESQISAAVRQRIVDETTQLQIKKMQNELSQTSKSIASEIARLGIQDLSVREQTAAVDAARVKFGGQLTAEMEAQVRAGVADLQTAKLKNELTADQLTVQTATVRLSIQDLDLREQQVAVDQARVKFGEMLTAEMEKQIRATVAQTQANRDALAIDQARRNLSGTMTTVETVQRGVTVTQRLSPDSNLAAEFKMDLDSQRALLDAKLINEKQYQDNILALRREFTNKANQLTIKQAADERNQRNISIQAEQQRLGKTAEQAKTFADFEMKTSAEKASFAIQAGSQVFAALGQQNKKAFEAAKAFNIANAVMNTYMAVTKALASYPFPFSLIAAGGALAFGLAQVAQIRSQQYSGRQLGGPVMAGESYMVGEAGPELFTPNTTGSITRNNDLTSGGTTNVNFTIVANDAQGFDDLLLQRRGMITQMISDAQLERGMRA